VTSQPSSTSPFRVLRDGFGLIGRFIREAPGAYALAATGAVVFTSAIVASSYVIGYVTDDVVIPVLGEGAPLQGRLGLAIMLIVGVSLWKTVGIVVRRTTAGWLQFGAVARLRKRLIDHQLKLTLRWYGGRATGDLLSVADNDANQATFVLAPLPFATGVSFLLVATVVVVSLTDVWLGLLAVGILLAVIVVDVRGAWLTFEGMQEAQRRRGRVGDVAHESFDGALTVKALGRETEETARFRMAAESLRDQVIRVGRVNGTYRAITDGLPWLGIVGILYVGVNRIASGALTPGELVRVAYLLSLLAVPVRLIGYLMWDVANSVTGWRRVSEVLDVDDVVTYGDVPASDPDQGADVTSTDVSFAYEPGELVIEDMDLRIPAGRTLAVVGPTGSGKSTLALLLARLWDPSDGAIRVDGRDLRSLQPGVVPSEIAYVSQETFLFDDTVEGNLRLNVDVTEQTIREAARLANADEFVSALPDGYRTHVGERGTTLSGGQRQRLALARALVRRPRLLILDDATSAVDPSVETAILRGLKQADLPATVIVVAYRRSSIVLADEVVYIEDGRVLDHGTHQQLLDRSPGYAALLRAYDEDADRRRAEAAAEPGEKVAQ